MFMKTIAVGPLEPAELCVTGGATVAILDFWSPCRLAWHGIDLVSRSFGVLLPRFVTSVREAMIGGVEGCHQL